MVLFLTSSPTGDLDGSYVPDGLDNRNGFLDQLRKHWKADSRCLIITAFPENIEASDEMRGFFENAVRRSGLGCDCMDLWDYRTGALSAEELKRYDVIFLGGGHVPTQNAFFHQIHLRQKLAHYDGILIGISAGSMNCAETVYAEPELPGEAVSADYRRSLEGLGLTWLNVLPHHQLVRENRIDGMRLFEDIIFPDSAGRMFLSLPDGSYIIQENGAYQIYGDYYVICDGVMTHFFAENS